jgi:hypothetical protein
MPNRKTERIAILKANSFFIKPKVASIKALVYYPLAKNTFTTA